MLDISDDNHAAIVHQRRHCRAGPGVVFRSAAGCLWWCAEYSAKPAQIFCTSRLATLYLHSIVTLAKVTSEC